MTRLLGSVLLLASTLLLAITKPASGADVPDWLHLQLTAPIPPHEPRTGAVLMYAETVLTVQANGRRSRLERYAYRILRPDGEGRGTVAVEYDPLNRLSSLRAWSLPGDGKPYVVKDKEIVDAALQGIEYGELLTDVRRKTLEIPASLPGNLVGYETLQDQQPFQLADAWDFQETVPVAERRYTLVLPAGWTYQATWLNHAPVTPTSEGQNTWHWILRDLAPVRLETNMPPWRGIAGRLWVTFEPPAGSTTALNGWHDIGLWYQSLTKDRRLASPQLKQAVADVTASEPTTEGKLRALAAYVQRDIRYVAIELGIGGYQPHAAADVLAHRYGDCKDKATLLSTMLREIGIDSYYVLINTARGSIGADTPPNLGFDHVILAIQLPPTSEFAQLGARAAHPKLGSLLYFDPTDDYRPLGSLSGSLQANYGLLVTPDGGELTQLPQLSVEQNGIERTGRFTLDDHGTLSGTVHEIQTGDPAAQQRFALRNVSSDFDKIRPIEALAAAAFGTVKIQSASANGLTTAANPLEWSYSLLAENYARSAGGLLLVRPRVIGSKLMNFWIPDEPRQNAIEFESPLRDTDVFEVTLPDSYSPEALAAPVNLDLGSVAYRSKTEFRDHILRYTRTYEVRELSIPVEKSEALRHFYDAVLADERATAIFRHSDP